MADPYRYFRLEARDLVDQLGRKVLDVENGGSAGELVGQLLRLAHTLKGAARVVRQTGIADDAHAIEGLLEPFRTSAEVPSDSINAVLGHLDHIAGAVAALSEPQPAATEEPAATPADGSFRTVRTEMGEIDALLDGVAETLARLTGLRRTAASLDRAGTLADILVAQISAAARRSPTSTATPYADRAGAIAEELRSITAGLRRDLPTIVDHVGRELLQVRNGAERLRLVPVGDLFPSLERAARDAGQALGKRITFNAKGGETRLDAQVLHTLLDALMQVVRNAAAHGIESEAKRVAAGKPPAGRITVSAKMRGRRVVVRCADDGGGIDVAAVRSAALRRGMGAAEVDALDRDGVVRLLSRGGLSTAESLTQVSGRGIGMDIAREAVERLGGKLAITTEPGRGSTFEFSVPLSLAAIEGLVVESNGVIAAIPLDAVRHAQRVAPGDISGSGSIFFDGAMVPFVPLTQLLQGSSTPPVGAISAVIVGATGGLAAIGVERLSGTEEITFHPLPELALADAVVAGASLNAAGWPQLVLDPDVLVARAAQGRISVGQPATRDRPILVIDDSLTTRMLEQSILESAGYTVEVAASAEEALDRAGRTEYALFLVDVEMPGIDGFTFVERIRADAALRDTPAILVTSLNSPEHLKRGEAVGAQGYMIKSEFDQAQLLALIERLAA